MQVHHVRRGTGEPLVLIHGIGHRWQAWQPVLDRLADHHDVIAVDLPGFGRTPVPDGGMPPDMPATIARFAEFLTTSGLDRPHIAGNSLGGAIALELAASGLVSSATAFAPAGFFTAAERRRALAILRAMRAAARLPTPVVRHSMRLAAFRAVCFAPLVVHPRRIDHERAVEDALALRAARGFASVARSARDYRFAGLPVGSVPVTVAWGARDRILPPRQAERARRLLPGARHVTLPACGHVPMSDDPGLVSEVILQTTGVLTKPR